MQRNVVGHTWPRAMVEAEAGSQHSSIHIHGRSICLSLDNEQNAQGSCPLHCVLHPCPSCSLASCILLSHVRSLSLSLFPLSFSHLLALSLSDVSCVSQVEKVSQASQDPRISHFPCLSLSLSVSLILILAITPSFTCSNARGQCTMFSVFARASDLSQSFNSCFTPCARLLLELVVFDHCAARHVEPIVTHRLSTEMERVAATRVWTVSRPGAAHGVTPAPLFVFV